MSALTLESVISDEIITEFSQEASATVIWRDCSNWLNEQRTFKALRNYAPSWFSMLIMHTSSQELLELASDDHGQDIRYSVAKNPNTPRYLLEMLAGGASEWVKDAALANPKIAGFYVGQPEVPAGLQVVPEAEVAAEATPEREPSIEYEAPYCALAAMCVAA
jgi:hypothetical protein